jgi:hypothetical protein
LQISGFSALLLHAWTGSAASPASLAFTAAGSRSPTLAFRLRGARPFTFSALKAGTCSYTITGSAANVILPITVTTTTLQGK